MSRTSPMRPTGCRFARNSWVSGACIGVLMMPGATAFTRMPLLAYSIASDLVAAANPPLVSEASTEGTLLLAWSRKLVVICTMCPEHLRYEAPGQPEESDNVDGEDFREVFLGVVDE